MLWLKASFGFFLCLNWTFAIFSQPLVMPDQGRVHLLTANQPSSSKLIVFVGGMGESCKTYEKDMEWAQALGLSSICFIQRTEESGFVGTADDLLQDFDELLRNLSSEGWSMIHIVSHSMGFLTVEAWLQKNPDATNFVSSVTYTNPMSNIGNFLSPERAEETLYEGQELETLITATYHFGSKQRSRPIPMQRNLAFLKTVQALTRRIENSDLSERANLPTYFFITSSDPNPDHEHVSDYIRKLADHGIASLRYELTPSGRDHHNPAREGDHFRIYLRPVIFSPLPGHQTPENASKLNREGCHPLLRTLTNHAQPA